MARDRLLLLAFFLSGLAALGYELLWTRLLSIALGSETLGILAVLSGFFGGMALGSWFLHGAARRSRDPARLFAVLEGIAALFALLSPFWLSFLARELPPILGPLAGDNDTPLALFLALAVAVAALLPGTVCLGGTFAALVEARRRVFVTDPEGRGLGRLYAANTFGATLGIVATVFVLMPRLGLPVTAVVLSALGLCAAALATAWSRRQRPAEGRASEGRAGGREGARGPDRRRLLAILTFTGLAAVGLEVVAIQILRQVLEDTVYTFASLLAAYLVGTAVGAAVYGRWAGSGARRPREAVTAFLLFLQTLTVVGTGLLLQVVPWFLERVGPMGSGAGRRMAAEILVAALVFAAPTVVMGALFSHLMAPIAPAGVGRAYALNTLGGTLAPFVFGVGLLHTFGYRTALALVALVYLALFVESARRAKVSGPRRWGAVAALGAVAGLGLPSLVLVQTAPGWREIYRAETLHGLVLVSELEGGGPGAQPLRQLQVDRNFRMGGAMSFGERRMGHIPLLLAPGAESGLVLGIGTGATLGAVRHFPLKRVDAVELVPAVLEVLPAFGDINEGVFRHEAVTFHAADARRFVASRRGLYDVVIGDLFHPARDGAGGLYSREHFQAVRDHLADGALYVQWLPLYQLDEENLRTVLRTFLAVYPEVHSFLGIFNAETPALALVGRDPEVGGPLSIALDRLSEKLRDPVYESLLMSDPRDLLASYMLDREALEAFAGDGALNTDLEPRVLFDAPRSAYAAQPSLGWGNLEALLSRRVPYPEALVVTQDARRGQELRAEVATFSTALGLYLRGEILRTRAGAGFPAPALQAYLAAYEAAPDFRAARALLLALAAREPALAGSLLPRMLRATPREPLLYRVRLRHLRAAGDREAYLAVLEEARRQCGDEVFPDLMGSAGGG